MIRPAVILLPVVAMLSACDPKPEATVYADGKGNEASVIANGSGGGKPAVRVRTDQGEVVVKTTDNGDNLPLGLAMYPGATVKTNMSATGGTGGPDATGGMIVFESADAPDKVAAFFREQAVARGMTIKMDNRTGSTVTFVASGRGGEGIYLTAQPGGEGGTTSVQLIAGKGN